MWTDMVKENRKSFSEDGRKKLDFLPTKYFKKFVEHSGMEYDHPMLYRDAKWDYFVASLYKSEGEHERMIEEGFTEIPCMYSESCRSYMKRFKNTKTSVIEEA